MRILLFPPIPWDYPMRQRPQHLAIQFAREGHQVEYVDVAGEPGRRVTSCGLSARTPRSGSKGRRGLRMLKEPHQVLFLGLRGAWDNAVDPDLESMLDETPTPDVAIIQSPGFAPMANRLKERGIVVVYDRVDNWPQFPGVPERWPRYDKELCTAADLLWATHPDLLAGAEQGISQVLIPNGYDPEVFFPAGPLPGVPLPEAPRVLYSGTLGAWLDWDTLVGAAQRLSGIQFLLVGAPHNDGSDSMPSTLPGNVHMMGPRPFEQLGALYRACDVGIIPFRTNELTRAVDPVKAYEYLASGLPVVATGLPSLRGYPNTTVAETPDEFVDALASSCECAGTDLSESCAVFLADKTWAFRAKSALDSLHKRAR